METKPAEQLAGTLEPPEVVIVVEQIRVGDDPSACVTTKPMSSVVDVTIEKSKEADHEPAGIDSSADG